MEQGEGTPPASASQSATPSAETATTIIVARHGERLDYYLRDYKESNFITETESQYARPWDPPLTSRGRLQGRKLGEILNRIVRDLNYGDTGVGDDNGNGSDGKADTTVKTAPLGAVYSSPLIRCVQTAAEAIIGYTGTSELYDDDSDGIDNTYNNSDGGGDSDIDYYHGDDNDNDINDNKDGPPQSETENDDINDSLKVKVEPGLVEILSEKFYRSWSLPNSNGTWGGNGGYEDCSTSENDVHECAKLPSKELLRSPKETQQCLSSLSSITTKKERTAAATTTTATNDNNFDDSSDDDDGGIMLDESLSHFDMARFSIMDNSALTKLVHDGENNDNDQNDHLLNVSSYYWDNFENKTQLIQRLDETIDHIAKKHPNQTVLLLSHGSPCTQLYGLLTGDECLKNHGYSSYASFSIYRKKSGDVGSTSAHKNSGKWEALMLSENRHVRQLEQLLTADAWKDDGYDF